MRIAVVGGTGTLGRLVIVELRRRGHDVRVLSRSSPDWPVDLRTGAGLADAVGGCDAVVDASNDDSKQAAQTLVDGVKRLLAAEAAAGVGHHVCVSIVGCESVQAKYFATKVAQELAVKDGPVCWSIVRATQFHELVSRSFEQASRWGIVPLPRVRVQPVACEEVAVTVADVAEGEPLRGQLQVAGPQIEDVRALARSWAKVTGRRLVALPILLPGRLGRALRGGALTAEHPDVSGRTAFVGWLAATHSAQ